MLAPGIGLSVPLDIFPGCRHNIVVKRAGMLADHLRPTITASRVSTNPEQWAGALEDS